MKIIDDNGADREFLERIANLEHLEKIENMSELKPCPFCSCDEIKVRNRDDDYETIWDWRVSCSNCYATMYNDTESEVIADWNQRQPHPDTKRLDWLQENIDSAYTRYEIDRAMLARQAMEQEK